MALSVGPDGSLQELRDLCIEKRTELVKGLVEAVNGQEDDGWHMKKRKQDVEVCVCWDEPPSNRCLSVPFFLGGEGEGRCCCLFVCVYVYSVCVCTVCTVCTATVNLLGVSVHFLSPFEGGACEEASNRTTAFPIRGKGGRGRGGGRGGGRHF